MRIRGSAAGEGPAAAAKVGRGKRAARDDREEWERALQEVRDGSGGRRCVRVLRSAAARVHGCDARAWDGEEGGHVVALVALAGRGSAEAVALMTGYR